MNRLVHFLLCGVLALSASAVEYFADPVKGDDSYDGLAAVYDGTHGPTKSAQAAVTLAEAGTTAEAMNVVTLLPGDYRPAVGDKNCIAITKPIRLRSRRGRADRDVTRVFGLWDTTGENGCGPNAVRCLNVDKTAAGTVVEGLTLRDGATGTTGTEGLSGNAGGGVYCPDGGSVTLVDCAVLNCRALNGGAAARATAVRTLFRDNGAAGSGAATYRSNLYNCMLVDNVNLGTAEGVSISVRSVHVINCTFCGNRPATTVLAYGVKGSTVIANNLIAVNGQFKTISSGTKDTSLKTDYLHNCVNVASGTSSYLTHNGNKAGNAHELFSPATDDWRLTADAVSVTAGDVQWLELIPEEYRDTDFYGNPRKTGDVVYCGAVQATATPASGALAVTAPDAAKGRLHFAGAADALTGTYVQSETWPTFVDIAYEEVDPAYGLVRFTQGDDTATDGSGRIWATTNDIARLLLPGPGTTETVSAIVGTKVYASATATAGSGDGSAANPYTLQEAADVDAVKVVVALPGDYDSTTGSKTNGGIPTRLAVTTTKASRIIAAAGPAVTTIRGQAATSPDALGCGTDAVRCVYLPVSGDCVVQGFTLADGRTDTGSKQSGCGGGLFASNSSLTPAYISGLADCVITNCSASRGAAIMSGRLVRCRVLGCASGTAGVLSTCHAYATLVRGCSTSKNALCHNIKADRPFVNCTFVDNQRVVADAAELMFCNDILSGNAGGDFGSSAVVSFYGTVFAAGGANVDLTQATRAAAQFVDAEAGDYRLLSTSPGAGTGFPEYLRISALDLEGNPYPIRDGRVTAGAFADMVAMVHVAEPTCPGMELSVTGDLPVGPAGIDISLVADGGRRILGFTDGDTTQAVTTVHVTYDEALAKAPLAYSLAYDQNLYVSPTGDDGADGLTADTPRQTLAAIMAKAVAGDVVHAAAGTYADGAMKHAEGALDSRVVVPTGVRLVSAEGAEKTTIVGQAASDGSHAGLGDDAVRCAYLMPDATLAGFTLTGGRAAWSNAVDRFDMYGAGVCCADVSSRLVGCVVSNNVGYSRVGLYQGTAVRCKIVRNTAKAKSDGHPGAVSASLDTCFVADNEGGYNVNVISGAGNYTIRNCSIGPRSVGTHTLWMKNTNGKVNAVVNTLFFNGAVACAHTVSNCVFESEECNFLREDPTSLMAGNVYGDTSADAEGRPLWGNAAIDAGDASMTSADGLACDLGGGQRVYGGRLDVGCHEFDWRPRFAAAMGTSHALAVCEASPDVITNATGGVRVPTGACLVCRVKGRPDAAVSFAMAATDDATLASDWNGSPLATVRAADGVKSVKTDAEQAENDLSFACTGETGWGVISDFVRLSGMMFIVK